MRTRNWAFGLVLMGLLSCWPSNPGNSQALQVDQGPPPNPPTALNPPNGAWYPYGVKGRQQQQQQAPPNPPSLQPQYQYGSPAGLPPTQYRYGSPAGPPPNPPSPQ